MSYDHKNNTGTLFNNEDKKNKPTSPDWSGDCKVDNKNYRLAGWYGTLPSGKQVINIAIYEDSEQKSTTEPAQDKIYDVPSGEITLDNIDPNNIPF